MDVHPFVTVAQALQAAFEGLNTLAGELPAPQRRKVEATATRIFQAKVALMVWVDEQS